MTKKPSAANQSRKPARGKPAARTAPARVPASVAANPEEEPEPDMQSILKEVSGQNDVKRLEHWETVSCPYCGENFEVHIEAAEDGQTMYEDCHVCCKPISLHVEVDEEEVHVTVGRS